MTTFRVSEFTGPRVTCQLIPDTTGKLAHFQTSSDPGEDFALPVVGWAVVVVLEDDRAPRVECEPVVEEECYGPIAVGDLMAEAPFLRLKEVT